MKCAICKKIIRNIDRNCLQDVSISASGMRCYITACQTCSKRSDVEDLLVRISDIKLWLIDNEIDYKKYQELINEVLKGGDKNK
jgi:hypothetical protein